MSLVLSCGAFAAVVAAACRSRAPDPPVEAALRVEAGPPSATTEADTTSQDARPLPAPAAAAAVAAEALGTTEAATEAAGPAAAAGEDPFAATIAIDLHADVVLQVAEHGREFAVDDGEWTIERARLGGLDAQVFPLWISPRQEDQQAALKRAERAFLGMIEGSGGALAVARTAAEIRERSAAGELSALLGIEGALPLGDDPANIEPLIAMGLRYLGLTWNVSNAFAEAAADEREPHGLTEAGRRLVELANDAGVLLDLSHASAATFWDVHRLSRSPVLVSHAGLRALRDIPRNIDDLQLLALARSGGVMGIVWHSGFLAELPEGETTAPLSALLDAYDHARALGVAEAMGLGSDLDGGIHPPAELATIDGLPALARGLDERGWTDAEIAGVLGENFLRLLEAADAAARPPAGNVGSGGRIAAGREWPAEARCTGLGTTKEEGAVTDRRIAPGPVVPEGTIVTVEWAGDEGAERAALEIWGEAGGEAEVLIVGPGGLDDRTGAARLTFDESGAGRVELPEWAARARRVTMMTAGEDVRLDEIVVWVGTATASEHD